MKIREIILEDASNSIKELKQGLLKLPKEQQDYDGIDRLMKRIAKENDITPDDLHDYWMDEYDETPDDWIKKQDITETDMVLDRGEQRDLGQNKLMRQFINVVSKTLKLENQPEFEFSYDTDVAKKGHHTGRFTPEGQNGKVWIYCANRNMVDIMRTVAHELCHCRQREENRIKPDSARPGSPIEREADVFAGAVIKLFGKKHREIFESR